MVAAEPLNAVKVGELDPYAFFAFLGYVVVAGAKPPPTPSRKEESDG